jgi:tetratricopeptide (TPR) repeat protein
MAHRVPLTALALVLLAPALSALAADDGGETTSVWIETPRARIDRLLSENRLREAVEEWMALARLQPDEIAPVEQAALLAVRCGELKHERFRPGERFFAVAERVVRQVPKADQATSPPLLYVIGRLNYAAGSHHEAYLMFVEARRLECDVEDLDRYAYRAAANRAVSLLESGREDVEDLVIETILAEMERSGDDPELPDVEKLYANVNLAAAHNQRQEEPAAIKLLDDAIEKYRDKVPGTALGWAYRLLGDIRRNQGAMDAAIAHYRKLLEVVNPTESLYADGLIRLADAQLRAEPPQLVEAERRCRDYLALRRGDATGLLTLGRILDEAGRPAEALVQYRAARESAPDAINVLDRLQSALYLLDTPEARAELADVKHAIEYIRRDERRPVKRREDE